MTTESTQPFQPVAPEPGSAPEPMSEPSAPSEAPPATAASVPAPKAKGTPRWLNVALALAVAVAIGGVAFAAGRMTAPGGLARFGNGPDGRDFAGNGGPGVTLGGGPNDGQNGQGGPRAFAGGASIEGTVTAVTADSMTIKTASGQEITIALDSTTTYHQQSSATSTDVKTGGTVIVRLGLGKAGSGTQTGPTANDVTVVPQ
jgi:hypothetical protein